MESLTKLLFASFLIIVSSSISASKDCPKILTNTTQYARDPNDCRTYWICNSKVQKKMRCPLNQCFNPEFDKCTSEKDTECDPSDSTRKLFPDCDNCTMYFQCSNGQKVHQKCPNDLWFNYPEQRCDYIRNYPVLNGCGDVRCTEGPDNRKYPVDLDTKKFLWCISGRAYLYECCKKDEKCYFDEGMQACVINAHSKSNFIKKDGSIRNYDAEEPAPSFCRSAPKFSLG